MNWLVLGTVFVLGLAYLVYTPFPPQASNRGFKMIAGFMFRTVTVVGKIGEFLGFGNSLNIIRAIIHSARGVYGGDDDRVTEATMDGVRVLIIRPKSSTEELLPGIVFYHGGGWILMNPDGYLPSTRYLSDVTNSIVISVDYRLAPEHVFPAAIDDTIRVTRYFLQNARDYGVDPSKVGVAGDSAGGNLAMATALHLATTDDKAIPSLKFQFLIYPPLQMVDMNLPSYTKYAAGPGLLRKDMMIEFFLMYLFGETSMLDVVGANQHTSPKLKKSEYASYVSRELLPSQFRSEVTSQKSDNLENEALWNRMEEKILNPLFSPLMAPDNQLSKLPPTYLIIAEFDVLRDDGFMAAARLKQANVPVKYDYLHSEEHGCIGLTKQAEVKEAFAKFVQFFQEQIKA